MSSSSQQSNGAATDADWQPLREWRHNPCLMRPMTGFMLVLIAVVWIAAALLKVPAILLGLVMRPVMHRMQFVVEFIYPTDIGRWAHFFIIRLMARKRKQKPDDMNCGHHSRAAEQRVEVVLERVFVHPLPQLLDNLGYLVVCVPPKEQPRATLVDHCNGPIERISVVSEHERRIVALVVDCGDADAVADQVEVISQRFYESEPIEIHSILSTHKHHDHTAGNKDLMEHPVVGKTIKTVVGGAVEKVPHCNFPVANGEMLPLPKYGANDMNALAEIEVIGTPAHTRGSVCYALRPLKTAASSGLAFLFTGDTMFCAGGGVPFEADIENDQEVKAAIAQANSPINPSAANNAIERCFAEILGRSVHNASVLLGESVSDRILVFPGHEYTSELLTRQLALSTSESCKWRNYSPRYFFETASELYVAMHRRSLPHSSGKLLNVPSTVRKELLINPHFRSLAKRGDVVISALRLWHTHFAREKVPEFLHETNGSGSNGTISLAPTKSIATDDAWNLDASDVDQPVFTTVYASDLNSVIAELDSGDLSPHAAVQRLKDMQRMLDEPVIGRRPIPNTLPTRRTIYKGLLGMALLGSHATALTLSDSRTMKLPPPVFGTGDLIRISKKRLIAVLNQLGLLGGGNDGRRLVAMIQLLWKEANDCAAKTSSPTRYDTESANDDDEVELGMLKWIVYGLASNQPSWFSKFCMPCSKPAPVTEALEPSAASRNRKLPLPDHDLVNGSTPLSPLTNTLSCPVRIEIEEADWRTCKTRYLFVLSLPKRCRMSRVGATICCHPR